jgi:SAM-dependent methyltransferase
MGIDAMDGGSKSPMEDARSIGYGVYQKTRRYLARRYSRLRGHSKRIRHRTCPLCDWSGFQFLPAKPGPFFRFDAICPRCGSAERHRLAYVLLKEVLQAPLPRVLHFAPERPIERWLRSVARDYVSTDLRAPAMCRVDIQALPFRDATFDLVWCSHVLEHVPSDRQAMHEIRRVLKDGGSAVIQVPIWGAATRENEEFPDEAQRVLAYFQADHLRLYGRDFANRLEDAGLSVTTRDVEQLPLHVVLQCGLGDLPGREVFLAKRSA